MAASLIDLSTPYWGRECRTYADVYNAAPFRPAVTLGGFVRRLRQRASFVGKVEPSWVERALKEPKHKYNGGGVVYEIVQLSTGRKYIGITDDPVQRRKAHFRGYASKSDRLHKEMAKAGPGDFEFWIVFSCDCPRHVLKRIERALIIGEDTIWPNGLNSLRGDSY